MSIKEALLLSLIPDIFPIEINHDVWILSSSASKQCKNVFFWEPGPCAFMPFIRGELQDVGRVSEVQFNS